MLRHSTVAARCAAIGSGIAQIITDTATLARGLRSARHELKAPCADLLAIKFALDIAHDDFSSANPHLPLLLLEAASELLDSCSAATEGWHIPIVRLSASQDRQQAWQDLKAAHLVALNSDLEAVRGALDLLLDLIDLFTHPTVSTTGEVISPTRHSFFDDSDPAAWQAFLQRVDTERAHVDNITQARQPSLYAALDKVRACVVFQIEECLSPQASPERPTSQKRRLVVPIPLDLSQRSDCTREKSLPPLPSPLSVSSGIGKWIANVVSQAIDSPSTHASSFALTDPRISFAMTFTNPKSPSAGTFFSDYSSSTTGRTASCGENLQSPKMLNLDRVDSPQLALKLPQMPKAKKRNGIYTIASTIISSEECSIIHQRLTNDKIAVAKDRRRCLTRDQRMGIDWLLKNVTTKTTLSEVEQILWEGADPNVKDLQYGTVLIHAAHSFTTPILRLLIEYGGDMTQTSHSTYYSAIHAAVLGTQLDNLQWLVDSGIHFDTPNQQGETPLHLAVRTPGGYPIAKWLLEMGADVNSRALDGATPFQMAMKSKVDSRERSMILELLHAQGADGEVSRESTQNRGKGLSVLGLI